MKFEVRWTKQFSTNFFGQLVRPGGTIQTPANLAIQLHEENSGWVCPEIDKARQSLEPPVDVTITDEDLQEKVVVPGEDTVPEVVPEVVVAPEVTPDSPPADVTPEVVPDASQVQVDVVPDVETLQPALDLTSPATADPASPAAQSKEFKCDLCPESFPSKKKLTAHKTQVHQNG